MKYRIYAYILLVVVVFYIIRPVMPYIEYAVNKEYIAKYLCINRAEPHGCCEGKCYLEKEIKKSNDLNDPKDTSSNKKVQYEDVKEFLNPHVTIPQVFETNITHLIYRQRSVLKRYFSTIFIPPKLEFLL